MNLLRHSPTILSQLSHRFPLSSRRVIWLLLVLFALAAPAAADGYNYVSPTGDCAVRFPEKPTRSRHHDGGGLKVYDSQGHFLLVYSMPKHLTREEFYSRIQNSNSLYETSIINVGGNRALRRTGFFRSEFGKQQLYEELYIVVDDKVYKLTARLPGKNRDQLEAKARAFWETFRILKK